MTIGTNIRIARIAKNLTQEALSKDIISRIVLSRIENGKSEPSVTQLIELAKRLGCDIYDLINPTASEEISCDEAEEPCDLATLFHSEKFAAIIGDYKRNEQKHDKTPLYGYYIGMSFVRLKDDDLAFAPLNKFCDSYYSFSSSNKRKYVIEFATAKNNIARILFFSKKVEHVKVHLDQAIFQLIRFGKIAHQVYLSTNQNLINYYIFIKQPLESIKIGKLLLSPSTNLLHKSLTAFMHQSLSVAYYDIGDFNQSHHHLYLADLLYLYSNNEDQSSLCRINRFNLIRELRNFNEAIEFISTEQDKYRPDNKQYHILGLQPAFAYINLEDYLSAEKCLSRISYVKLRVHDRHSYNFIKGIILFNSSDFVGALKKFNSCESYFSQQKFFYDLDYMNSLRYKATGNIDFLKKIRNPLANEVTKNVFLFPV